MSTHDAQMDQATTMAQQWADRLVAGHAAIQRASDAAPDGRLLYQPPTSDDPETGYHGWHRWAWVNQVYGYWLERQVYLTTHSQPVSCAECKEPAAGTTRYQCVDHWWQATGEAAALNQARTLAPARRRGAA